MTDQLYMTMNDGHKIPAVGLGTWKSEPGDSTYNAVLASINAGYRHIDTARAYDNESDVGRAVNDAGVCLLYTSPSPRDATLSRMPSSA